jgi:hypothetical protein
METSMATALSTASKFANFISKQDVNKTLAIIQTTKKSDIVATTEIVKTLVNNKTTKPVLSTKSNGTIKTKIISALKSILNITKK